MDENTIITDEHAPYPSNLAFPKFDARLIKPGLPGNI